MISETYSGQSRQAVGLVQMLFSHSIVKADFLFYPQELDPVIQEVSLYLRGCCIQCHAVYTARYMYFVFVFLSVCHLIHYSLCVCACLPTVHQLFCVATHSCTSTRLSSCLSLRLPWLCSEESCSTGETDAFWRFGFTFSFIMMPLELQ